MEQTRTGGAGEQPRGAPGEEAAKRIIVGGDAPASGTSGSGCFDCNICLECATEPVVTLCGHLYCWPCIYEWLRHDVAEAGARSSARRQCPVCKAAVSPDALVPLYGRGGSSSAKKPLASIPRPRRPALRQSTHDSGSGGHHHHHRHAETSTPARSLRHPAHAHAAQFDALLSAPFGDRGMLHSTTSTTGGMLGGMAVAVLPLVLRGQARVPGMYYPSPYHLMSPRQRRWHVEDTILRLRATRRALYIAKGEIWIWCWCGSDLYLVIA
uniref:E3 ubiquitin-protein ligase RMA n=1 Tax=Zea mays TaxID=4577 RepID=A0A804U8Q4_MAIZE